MYVLHHIVSYLMIGLNLPVEQPVLEYCRVAVDRPGEQIARCSASGVRRGPEDGRSGATVNLDVLPKKKRNSTLFLSVDLTSSLFIFLPSFLPPTSSSTSAIPNDP